MPNLSPAEFLAHSTVRISCELSNGRQSTGSGFFYAFDFSQEGHIPAIVTNKHVVKGSRVGRFVLNTQDSSGNLITSQRVNVSLDNFETLWISHPDPQIDLCVLPIAPLQQEAQRQSRNVFYTILAGHDCPTDQEWATLSALEDVVMVGYPIGIWDAHNNMPVMRRGTTATSPRLNYNGKQEFMIDAACFPGSSGSPVFLFNNGTVPLAQGGFTIGTRIKLLGVLYAGPQYNAQGQIVAIDVPTQAQQIAVSSIPTNLGYVIKSSALTAFEQHFKSLHPPGS